MYVISYMLNGERKYVVGSRGVTPKLYLKGDATRVCRNLNRRYGGYHSHTVHPVTLLVGEGVTP